MFQFDNGVDNDTVQLYSEFVDRFSDETDRYIASLIVVEQIPVRVASSNVHDGCIAVDINTGDELYDVVCDHFPGFFVESLISFDEARDLCQTFSLPMFGDNLQGSYGGHQRGENT